MKRSSEVEAHCGLIKDKFKQSCAELGIEVRHYHFTVLWNMISC